MTLDRARPLVLPLAALLAFEVWARATDLQGDSLAPDHSMLAATRDPLFSTFAGLVVGSGIGLAAVRSVEPRLMEVSRALRLSPAQRS
jgi:hypothetical protein